MKERPILFSAPMVRAILDGSKTQTRRIIKPDPGPYWHPSIGLFNPTVIKNGGYEAPGPEVFGASDESFGTKSPYGKPGDRLYVRETWAPGATRTMYRAGCHPDYRPPGQKWKPSIHMPRALSRITLEVTGVRVERLNDISETDCRAEGYPAERNERSNGGQIDPWLWYRSLWESINGPKAWDANPWVWVVELRRMHP